MCPIEGYGGLCCTMIYFLGMRREGELSDEGKELGKVYKTFLGRGIAGLIRMNHTSKSNVEAKI